MANGITTSKVLITDVSDGFRSTQAVEISELRDLAIPVHGSLRCDVFFDSPRPSAGTRLLISVNGEDVSEIRYEGDDGQKQDSVDLTDKMEPGENDFRVRCLTSCDPVNQTADSALVWLSNGQGTIIKKRYSTRGSLEPFDQRWTLWFE